MRVGSLSPLTSPEPEFAVPVTVGILELDEAPAKRKRVSRKNIKVEVPSETRGPRKRPIKTVEEDEAPPPKKTRRTTTKATATTEVEVEGGEPKTRRKRKAKTPEPVVYDIPPVERKHTTFKGRLGYVSSFFLFL
jgi:UV DNA damage endonuclease